jgi:hypothetical protein
VVGCADCLFDENFSVEHFASFFILFFDLVGDEDGFGMFGAVFLYCG